jgi:cytochrome c oxidase subunit 1
MHGTTMIFLAVMPLNSAFFNLLVPLQIGARDVAFPRLNAFSLWVFVAGAVILNVGWFIKARRPGGGLVRLRARSRPHLHPRHLRRPLDRRPPGARFVASIVGSLNFITTIINLRAPGMTMMRLPVFTWMALITSFLLILACRRSRSR